MEGVGSAKNCLPYTSCTPHGFNKLFSSTEKSSSLPGSSRELTEIFGGSDDEDMEFPFSLGVGKTFPDLSLPDERVSDFFLKSIDSLSVPVSMESTLVPMEGTAEKEVSAESGKVAAGGGDGTGKDTGSKEDEVKEPTEAIADSAISGEDFFLRWALFCISVTIPTSLHQNLLIQQRWVRKSKE